MNTIVLMRHGETYANKKLIIQGRMDNPLNDTGRAQARQTGAFLKQRGEQFDVIVTSPLSRAWETAKIVSSELGYRKAVQTEPELVERNFGDFDGKKIDENYARVVVLDMIPNMEKNAVLETRVEQALRTLCETNPGKKILVVTHSHVIKSCLVRLVPGFIYTSYLFNCSLNYLTYDQGTFAVLSHNVNPLD
jgi:broad specificity phosphatase PhoE